jgi:hypothetical protein
MGALAGLTSVTIKAKTVFGNKRIVIGEFHIGDGAGGTFPVAGLALSEGTLGLREIEYISFSGGNMNYTYDYTNQKVLGWVAGTAANSSILVAAANTVPHETVQFMAVGFGVK